MMKNIIANTSYKAQHNMQAVEQALLPEKAEGSGITTRDGGKLLYDSHENITGSVGGKRQ